MIKHIVLLRFKSELIPALVNEHEIQFQALGAKIPEILGLEWGLNVSTEGLTKGFSHCFHLCFKDAETRDRYLVHPEHQGFSESIKPSLEDVLVVDYEIDETI